MEDEILSYVVEMRCNFAVSRIIIIRKELIRGMRKDILAKVHH